MTAPVDIASQAVLDIHCTTRKRHDTQLAADKGYNWLQSPEKLWEEGVRPLIQHREFLPIDHAHNVRIDDALHGKIALSETIFSFIKRVLYDIVRT